MTARYKFSSLYGANVVTVMQIKVKMMENLVGVTLLVRVNVIIRTFLLSVVFSNSSL